MYGVWHANLKYEYQILVYNCMDYLVLQYITGTALVSDNKYNDTIGRLEYGTSICSIYFS